MDARPRFHPLIERQWSFDEFTLLKVFLALLGCALSFAAMVFYGGYSLIFGPLALAALLVGAVLLGLARTDHDLTVALRILIVAGVAGCGPIFYLSYWL